MNLGEKLLELVIEYKDTIELNALSAQMDVPNLGREPSEIGKEFERTLRLMLTSEVQPFQLLA
jgi:hypothetical protein